ncbi:MAG: hypothetical protein A07HR60_01929 [uncultured archaeon A07HR60]|nr:MAG: hypothetical protein A07HR60_01929 [uncultured archaeon A07HR60]
MDHERIVVLAHEDFPERAKTALGVMRYGDQEVVAVLDRDHAGQQITDHVPNVTDGPIVSSFSAARELVDQPIDAVYIGIAPIGGGFDDSWRADIRAGIEAGCDIVAGLHYFLEDDDEFASLAADTGVQLRDIRRPEGDLTVSQGVADEVDAEIVLTVGTDCSVGKMTSTLEIVETLRDRGADAAMIPTGQTGIMIEGWGTAVDRVVADFTAGAVEKMILDVGDEYEYLVVEGQGSIVHPAYSAVTCGILHGAMPDHLVLCHAAGRTQIHGYESFELPAIGRYVELYEELAGSVSGASVVAGCLNTSGLDATANPQRQVKSFSEQIDAPATDPIRFGTEAVADALTEATGVDPDPQAGTADETGDGQ